MYGLVCLTDQVIGLMVGVTGQLDMLTPSRHPVPPLVCPGACVCPNLNVVFFIRIIILIAVHYLFICTRMLFLCIK